MATPALYILPANDSLYEHNFFKNTKSLREKIVNVVKLGGTNKKSRPHKWPLIYKEYCQLEIKDKINLVNVEALINKEEFLELRSSIQPNTSYEVMKRRLRDWKFEVSDKKVTTSDPNNAIPAYGELTEVLLLCRIDVKVSEGHPVNAHYLFQWLMGVMNDLEITNHCIGETRLPNCVRNIHNKLNKKPPKEDDNYNNREWALKFARRHHLNELVAGNDENVFVHTEQSASNLVSARAAIGEYLPYVPYNGPRVQPVKLEVNSHSPKKKDDGNWNKSSHLPYFESDVNHFHPSAANSRAVSPVSKRDTLSALLDVDLRVLGQGYHVLEDGREEYAVVKTKLRVDKLFLLVKCPEQNGTTAQFWLAVFAALHGVVDNPGNWTLSSYTASMDLAMKCKKSLHTTTIPAIMKILRIMDPSVDIASLIVAPIDLTGSTVFPNLYKAADEGVYKRPVVVKIGEEWFAMIVYDESENDAEEEVSDQVGSSNVLNPVVSPVSVTSLPQDTPSGADLPASSIPAPPHSERGTYTDSHTRNLIEGGTHLDTLVSVATNFAVVRLVIFVCHV